MRQLSYDQVVVMVTGEPRSSNLLTTEVKYVGDDKQQILKNYEIIFWPDKARMG